MVAMLQMLKVKVPRLRAYLASVRMKNTTLPRTKLHRETQPLIPVWIEQIWRSLISWAKPAHQVCKTLRYEEFCMRHLLSIVLLEGWRSWSFRVLIIIIHYCLRLCRLYRLLLRISKVLASRYNKSCKIPVSSIWRVTNLKYCRAVCFNYFCFDPQLWHASVKDFIFKILFVGDSRYFGSDYVQNVRMVIKRNSPQKQSGICHCYFSPNFETMFVSRLTQKTAAEDSPTTLG